MICHICTKSCESFVHKKTKLTYYHCNSCEYIFKSPEYYQDLELQKERYNLHENNEEDEGYRAYFQRFLNFVFSHVDEPKRALDFGCGRTALLATLLEEHGVRCDYYDPIYYPQNLKDTKKFDLIVSTEVFEHLHQPKEVLADLIMRLNKDGYLAIQTEFHTNDRIDFQNWWYPQDCTHIVFFRAKTFLQLSTIFGLKYIADNGKNMVILQKVH